MAGSDGSGPGRFRRAVTDAAWMYLCAGIGWVCTILGPGTSGFVAVRHGELFIERRREQLLFSFPFWKSLGFSGSVSLMLAEWVFAGIIAVALYLPIRHLRSTGRVPEGCGS